MMKPAGSPPGYVCVFLVVGSTSVTSDECSARTCAILIWGPSGVTVPPLPKRIPCAALTQPRSIIVWMRPAAALEPSVRPIVDLAKPVDLRLGRLRPRRLYRQREWG